MRITMIAVGTRGDVQPLLALGTGLRAAGHRVRFATEAGYGPSAVAAGLEHFAMSGNSERVFSGRVGLRYRELLEKPDSAELREKYATSFAGSLWFQHMRRQLAESLAACEGSDLLICQSWSGIGPSIAEKLGIPVVVAAAFPVADFPTAEFPSPWQELQSPDMTAEEKRRTWDSWAQMWGQGSHHFIQEWRTDELKLKRQSVDEHLAATRKLPHILGYSPHVLPKPADWDHHVHVTGFWFLRSAQDYQAPEALLRFLDAGEPPIAVGFGSLVGRHPARLTRMVVEALQRAGRRGLLIQGWGGLRAGGLPDSMFDIPSVPYDWLLPRVAGLIHHGGAGTMAIALRSGSPQAIVAFGLDQSFWGRRTASLGVSPAPMNSKSITVEELTQAVESIATNATLRERALAVSDLIRQEDGVEQAVRIIEQIAGREAFKAAG
jgi:UDP:flavonoid glycosyltransferase YjiC (YdhE family)